MSFYNDFPVLQKGCCCFDLAVATLGLGFLQVIIESLDFYLSMWTVTHGWYDGFVEAYFLVYLVAIFDAIQLVVLGFLLIGVLKKNLTYIEIFVKGQPIFILTTFIGHLVKMTGHYFYLGHFDKLSALTLLFILSTTVLYTYIWWCAQSLHQKWIQKPTVRHADEINNGEQRTGNNEDVTSFVIEAENSGF